MKQLGAISLIAILLLGTVGVTVNRHYCAGKLASTSLFSFEGCQCQGMDDDSGCCTHEIETISLGDEIANETLDFEVNPTSLAVVLAYFCSYILEEQKVDLNEQFIKPPDLAKDIQLLKQSFLI